MDYENQYLASIVFIIILLSVLTIVLPTKGISTTKGYDDYYEDYEDHEDHENYKDESNSNISKGKVLEDNMIIDTYFCPQDNCSQVLIALILSSTDSIFCAFFDFDLVEIDNLLKDKSKRIKVRLIVDGDNSLIKDREFIIIENKSSFMHNKFCIFDKKIVLTGSTNPTINGITKNNNNMVIIRSRYLARNYLEEFLELYQGIYSKGNKVRNNKIVDLKNSIIIDNYFCPEDDCESMMLKALKSSEKSIYFMTYSFTSDKIANVLIKKHYQNISIEGIFEKNMATQRSSVYSRLSFHNISVMLDKNPQIMHHKVFIVDSTTIITGSTNPTNNGLYKNDENIIIISHTPTAKIFIKEFQRLN